MSARTRLHLSALTSALAAALMLSACVVGPDYERQNSTLPELYQEQTKTATSAAMNAEWWTQFNDPTLNRLVSQALTANQDLHAAIARMEAAEGVAREAGASLFPTVGLEASASHGHTSGKTVSGKTTGPLTVNNRHAALTLSYELDLWGRVRRSNEAARAEALASRFGRDAFRLSLIGQLTNEYLSLRANEAQMSVTGETLQSRRESLKIVQARVSAGSASDLDLAQAESALAAVEGQWSQARRLRAISEHQIGILVGQPGLRIANEGLSNLPIPPVPPAGLPSALIEARPDVRQAEVRLIAANARIGIAKAAYFPTIGLTGSYGSESAALANLFTSGAAISGLAIGLTMPIFDAGRTSARVDQASALQQESLANYQKTLQTAFREVSDAIVNLDEFAQQERNFTTQVASSKRAYELAKLRYESGYSAYSDVLDTQRTLNAAQLQHIGSRRDRLTAAVDLFKALGGGWQPDVVIQSGSEADAAGKMQ